MKSNSNVWEEEEWEQTLFRLFSSVEQRIEKQALNGAPDHWVEAIENVHALLYTYATNRERLLDFEWSFYTLLKSSRMVLKDELGRDPNLFIQFVCMLCRSENEEENVSDDYVSPNHHLISQVFDLLFLNRTYYPGMSDEGPFDADEAVAWARISLKLLRDKERNTIGALYVGRMLARTPSIDEDIWPAIPIRELLEEQLEYSNGLRRGMEMEKCNLVQPIMVSGADGETYQNTARRYRESAQKIPLKWSETARLLNGIAQSFERSEKRIVERRKSWEYPDI